MSEQEQRLVQAIRKEYEAGPPRIYPPPIPSGMEQLITALAQQTAAINRLAQSNEDLVQAMAQDGEMGDDMPPAKGLNGKPL